MQGARQLQQEQGWRPREHKPQKHNRSDSTLDLFFIAVLELESDVRITVNVGFSKTGKLAGWLLLTASNECQWIVLE